MGNNQCCGPSEDKHEMDGNGQAVPPKSPAGQDAPMLVTDERRSAPAPPSTPPPGSSGGGGLTFESALADLEAAEQNLYGSAFQGFNFGNAVDFSNAGLQDYIATNSALSMEEAETEILRVASKTEDMQVTLDGFVQLLQEHAASQTAILERFLGLSGGSESVEAGECRSGLLMFTNDNLGAPASSMTEPRWDRVFDTVMNDCGPAVSMEGWNNYCKRVARIIRVVHVGKL